MPDDPHAPSPPELLLLLGEDHCAFGELALATQAGRTAAAISVGSDAADGVRIFKGDFEVPNEDACLAVDQGPRTLLAVADAHHGFESSHALLDVLAEHLATAPIPANALELFDAVLALRLGGRVAHSSETTLALAVLDRSTRTGFCLGYGDSSILIVDPTGVRPLLPKSQAYVSPWNHHSLDPRRAHEAAFRFPEGALLVAFTDGVDECHYGRPETSIRPEHVHELYLGLDRASPTHAASDAADDPGRPREQIPESAVEQFVDSLGHLALQGVDGQPGGQDNLAILATR